jgi:hypothetical protein
VSWWVPIAFIAAAVIGVAIAFSLTAGRPRSPTAVPEAVPHGARRKSRFEQDNEVPWNPAAFVALIVAVAVLVGIGVLIEVL